ncbi:TIGR02186 family protein [Rhodomicrobium sp. Az07]|uniref:TIGR02186 family protein n=1 Tax=Rhodomicrobium sp. Az07 TaxID=2839034 RepID=UPI001BEC81AC|nr:TIGR02186 family protein [Rhodomicrobium sp. Az07]MBT3070828.1 TIGR02186 family protein [Rhodomicrobium sp. Az07]
MGTRIALIARKLRRIAVPAALALMLFSGTGSATSDIIEAGAAQNQFYIEPSYDGTSVVLFGAVDRDRLKNEPFDIAVTLRGPVQPVVVWKKDRRAGLWVNSQRLIFDGVPNYFAVLSTRPLADIAPLAERDRYGLGIDVLSLPIRDEQKNPPSKLTRSEFEAALVKQKNAAGLFVEEARAIDFFGVSLFRTKTFLPAAAGPGLYVAHFYVLQGGKVIGDATARIRLRKIGIEARLSTTAADHPWLYGVIAVLLAAVVGGATSYLTGRRA